MGRCSVCGRHSSLISSSISVCADCLRTQEEVPQVARSKHEKYRIGLGLPPTVPGTRDGPYVRCQLCVNECVLRDGEAGFCGLWVNEGNSIKFRVGLSNALGFWYLDPHPTNCVAAPVCPANTGRGYPRYTRVRGVEVGLYNLAVFFGGCSLDCLFCQNYEHKELAAEASRGRSRRVFTREGLVKEALSNRVSCICYFGGDPGPHTPYAIAASREILRRAEGQVKRICWETNGLQHPKVMETIANLSLESGGIVKIDWKAWTPQVYEALTGVNGVKAVERLKNNVRLVSGLSSRRDPPLLTVSTLLVPGYVDITEVSGIAEYLAGVDPEIPYVLLAFHPTHLMRDLPTTSYSHAVKAVKAAREAGLKEVYVGNEWLLSNSYEV
ncbi:MAG: radical SAM protein [Zestosphaera sp.]